MKTTHLFIAALACFSLIACSEDPVTTKDGGPKKEAGADKGPAKDGPPVTTYKSCWQCSVDTDCTKGAGNTGKCDQTTHTCTKCTETADCTGTVALGKTCKNNKCVQCESNTDCTAGTGNTGKCAADGTCTKCEGDTECETAYTTFGAKLCNTTTSKCVYCKSNTDCTKGLGNTGVCDLTLGTCTKCAGDTDCTAAFVNDTMNTGMKYCLASNSMCVQCKADTDCTGTLKVCNKTLGFCTCGADSQCTTGYKCK